MNVLLQRAQSGSNDIQMKNNIPKFPPTQEWDKRLFADEVCLHLKSCKTAHENPWFKVCDRDSYYTVEHKEPQVIVLPIIDHSSILFVRPKRPVLNDNPLELPAGGFEKNVEQPEQGAARELREEAGIEVENLKRFTPLCPISISPNREPHLAFVFQVDLSQLEFEKRFSHDDEIVEVIQVGVDAIPEMLNLGEIYVSAVIAVVGRYLLTR